MFDYLTIFCLATGKPIAQISDDESGFIMQTVAPQSLERLALSSMRPSLPWMQVTPQSLESIREHSPRELLAYLMNRLFAPIELDRYGKPLNTESWLHARRTRIANWQVIESADFGDENLDTMLFMLLDLDSRFNLTKLTKPQSITTLWSSWHHAFAKDFLFNLTEWRNKLVADQIKRDKQLAHAREFWSEGNRLTRLALANQFNRVAPAKRTVPESTLVARTLKQQKAARLAATVDFLDQLEAELTTRKPDSDTGVASGAVASVESTPKPKVKILRFGVKAGV